jgi:electron transport complex protein RnfG
MRDMVKPTISLFIICLVVSFCLAFVNGITKDTIAQRIEKDAEEQRKLVLSEASSFKLAEGWEDKDESGLIRQAYAAYNGEVLIGYVFSVFPKGYGGEIAVTVGISSENKISGVKIGNNNETPGLGTKTADDKFIGQYQDKDILKDFIVVKRPAAADNEIQAVSGATISSTAVTKAVQASAALGSKMLQEQNGGEVK